MKTYKKPMVIKRSKSPSMMNGCCGVMAYCGNNHSSRGNS